MSLNKFPTWMEGKHRSKFRHVWLLPICRVNYCYEKYQLHGHTQLYKGVADD